MGGWLGDRCHPGPDAVWTSPYLGLDQTARIAPHAAERDLPVHVEKRLRNRDLRPAPDGGHPGRVA